jgi:hypothetical protein
VPTVGVRAAVRTHIYIEIVFAVACTYSCFQYNDPNAIPLAHLS